MKNPKEETFDEKVQKLKGNLPLPSEINTQYLKVPSMRSDSMSFEEITFEKEYVDNICIGWKLKQ